MRNKLVNAMEERYLTIVFPRIQNKQTFYFSTQFCLLHRHLNVGYDNSYRNMENLVLLE